jgi:hypothetical protein
MLPIDKRDDYIGAKFGKMGLWQHVKKGPAGRKARPAPILKLLRV